MADVKAALEKDLSSSARGVEKIGVRMGAPDALAWNGENTPVAAANMTEEELRLKRRLHGKCVRLRMEERLLDRLIEQSASKKSNVKTVELDAQVKSVEDKVSELKASIELLSQQILGGEVQEGGWL